MATILGILSFIGVLVGFYLFGIGIWELDDYNSSWKEHLVFLGLGLTTICIGVLFYLGGEM